MTSHDHIPPLRAVRDVVALLGGTVAAADRLNVSASAVSIWLRKGCFPPARYLDISAAVEEQERRVDRSLFRETPRQQSETNAA